MCDVRYPGVCSSSMSARCCPVCPFPMSTAVDIGNGQKVAGDPHRTAASRHT